MAKMLFSAVEGNGQCLDGGAMFGHVPRPLWSRWERPDEEGRIRLSCRTLLIEADGLKILCETGIGAFFEPALARRYGVQNSDTHELLKNLKALKVREEDIDYVILSHLHFDHAGGLLPSFADQKKGQTALCFPKAHYVVGKTAFQRACHPHLRDRASFVPHLTDKLKQSKRLIIVEEDRLKGVLEGHLSFVRTEGHTPGQMHTLFQDREGQKIFFAGDLIPGRAWVHLPVTMGYDRWPEKLIEEKQHIYERAEKENWILFFTHDKSMATARVRQNHKGGYESYDEKPAFSRGRLSSL